MIINYCLSSAKFQVFVRVFFLQILIPADGHWEPALSLALDQVLVDLEALSC